MKFRSILVSLLVLILVACLSATSTPDAQTIARSVDEVYDHLHTLQADFTETYSGAGMERTESGTLWLKKPGKMRWEYRSPREKLFLSDGKDTWFYVPAEHQVRRTPLRKLDDLRSPLAFLLGKTRLEKELQGLSLATDVTPLQPSDLVLRGVPKGMVYRVNQVLLEITPSQRISRILIDEVDGSRTEYRFTNQKENLQVGDDKFQFRIPSGVEVYESDLGQ